MTVRAHLVGLWRGRELDAPVVAALEDGAVRFAPYEGRADIVVPFGRLDGLLTESSKARFYIDSGDVLELDGDDGVGAFARRVRDAAFLMPEVARDLRSFGDTTFVTDDEATLHDAWFGPLLRARRELQRVSDPARQVALADAATLARAYTDTIAQLAATYAAGDAAMERALGARLEDAAQPLEDAFASLAVAGSAVQVATADAQLGEWRRWVDAFERVMRAADGAWPDVRVIVARR